MIKPPCKDCTNRELNCHTICEKYKDYKNKYNKEKKIINDKKRSEYISSKYRGRTTESSPRYPIYK